MPGEATRSIAPKFDNSYARDLEGLYVEWQPSAAPAPQLVAINEALGEKLGFDLGASSTEQMAAILSGKQLPDGARPLAQAYAGHQFGGLSPQLGDGRAVLLGEIIGLDGGRLDIQLKGSGRTPFSRSGDGKATLGPMLREYLMSEAMHALGVPTTRALAVTTTGEQVLRDRPLPGAVLARVAASHIRVGTFEFFALRRDEEKLRRLADYSIARHYPELAERDDKYLAFFDAVVEAQASLLAKWMLVGFVHGVMNTDNMTISGETIDYGPCAFLDHYDPNAVFSSIDRGGRYAYANQPVIAQWNLTRFAETLIPLIGDDAEEARRQLMNVIDSYPNRYLQHWLGGMRSKLGLLTDQDGDLELVNGLYDVMTDQNVDFTLVFRRMSGVLRGDSGPVRTLFSNPEKLASWMARYERRQFLEALPRSVRADGMDRVNPIYIPRNQKVEEVLAIAVENGDFVPFKNFMKALSKPFSERPELEVYTKLPPTGAPAHVTFCGT
ncbi:MAG: YdiU family protein [Hyphomicrobium sp.]|nr:YdiU family protein [Hyphomicrobium sp.]